MVCQREAPPESSSDDIGGYVTSMLLAERQNALLLKNTEVLEGDIVLFRKHFRTYQSRNIYFDGSSWVLVWLEGMTSLMIQAARDALLWEEASAASENGGGGSEEGIKRAGFR